VATGCIAAAARGLFSRIYQLAAAASLSDVLSLFSVTQFMALF